MWTYTNGTIADDRMEHYRRERRRRYQDAGNWVGILFSVQAMGSVVWAIVLPKFNNEKMAYALSLVIGGVGFAMLPFLHDKYLLSCPSSSSVALGQLCSPCRSPSSPTLLRVMVTWVLTSDSSTAPSVFHRSSCSPWWWTRIVGGRLSPE